MIHLEMMIGMTLEILEEALVILGKWIEIHLLDLDRWTMIHLVTLAILVKWMLLINLEAEVVEVSNNSQVSQLVALDLQV